MEWAEGWANEDGSFSSVNEMGDSDAPSYNEMDDSDGLNARLNAVADELACPSHSHRVRDVLRDGEDLYEEGVRLWDGQEKERAGTAFLRSITLCQDALGDALDSMEEEELEALIALSEKQLALAREHGWATHDDDTGAGLPPAGPHVQLHPGGADPFAPNGGSYEDDYDQEEFEGSGDEFGTAFSEGDMAGGIGFPITVSNSTGESGDDAQEGGGGRSGGMLAEELPWPPALQERGASGSAERSRSTEPRLQGGSTLGDGWQLMEGGGSAFDDRAFDESRFGDRLAYQPHSMYDSLRSSPSRSSLGAGSGGQKANARAHSVYSDLSVVRMALGGPPPAATALPAAAALERPTERPAGVGQGGNRRRGGRLLPTPGFSPRSRGGGGTETESAVAHSTAHLLERSVEEFCPDLTTPRRKGWDPVHPKRSPGLHTPLQASTLRTTHAGSWSLQNYQTRDNLRHPRSTVNAFRAGGTPTALNRSLPRRAVRSPVNMYADSRPWRNSISGGSVRDDSSGGVSGSPLKEDQRKVLFTMADITRGAEAKAKLKLQQRAQKLQRIEAALSPPRTAECNSRRGVSPQKHSARERRLKRARELKSKRDAQKKQLEDAAVEFRKLDDGAAEAGSGSDGGGGEEEEAEQYLSVSKSGSFAVRWNDKLERSIVQEKQQKAKFLMEIGLNEEEHVKNKISPHMSYLSKLSTNAKRSYDDDAIVVKPMPCVHGAVALTDTGMRGGTEAKSKQAAAAAYADRIQEILSRAKERHTNDSGSGNDNGGGGGEGAQVVAAIVDLPALESRVLLDQHPGVAEKGGAFGQIDEPERTMAKVNKSTLLSDWPSGEIQSKAGSSGWNGWRPQRGMIGEILHRWDWDQGLWLLKIAAQPSGPGEERNTKVERYCVMPRSACSSVRVLGVRSISVDYEAAADDDDDEAAESDGEVEVEG